jgi:hypothetical protein
VVQQIDIGRKIQGAQKGSSTCDEKFGKKKERHGGKNYRRLINNLGAENKANPRDDPSISLRDSSKKL